MVYLCIECPDRTELCSTLMALFGSSDFDFDSTISYKTMRFNWQIHSVALESIVNKFIELPTEKIFENCLHDILIVQKAAYLRETKASLNNETCIILMNLLKIFHFLVQDVSIGRIRKLYFIHLQCTKLIVMVNLNVTVFMSYQINSCMIRL